MTVLRTPMTLPAQDTPAHPVVVDGRGLTVDDVIRVASQPGTEVTLDDNARRLMAASQRLKLDLMAEGRPIYGVTTGFGDSASRQISPVKAAELQRNLIRYHLNGTGRPMPDEVVRATLLIRANCLARGHSGVNPAVVERLLALLRHDVLPVIPERGSVGASGDLVPLCYLASALIGEGRVRRGGHEQDAAEALAELGLPGLTLEAKDGLGLINGTAFCAAVAVTTVAAAENLAVVADVCTALACEALLGNRGHFHAFIHEAKQHRGQEESAALIARLLDGSGLALSHDQVLDLNVPLGEDGFQRLNRTIQDRYSLRCAPHVTGVLRDTARWVRQWLEREINSSNDNPLFDTGGGIVHSGGNFYGGHVGQAMDSLKIAVASVADLLDRQLALMVDEKFSNGLPANLAVPVADDNWAAGLHHGYKGMQIACSAITAEALKNAAPATVFSRSTEAHNQDKVSMAPIAARDAYQVARLVTEVAAIHLLAACQALDLRVPRDEPDQRDGHGRHDQHDKRGRRDLGDTPLMSPRTRNVYSLVRSVADFSGQDRRLDGDIAAVIGLIESGELRTVALASED